MKKKKAELEQLLDSLIEKGWEPRGKNAYNCCDNAKRIWYEGGEESYRDYIEITPRKLTSKESGLWQFVCENEMIKSETGVWVNCVDGMYKEILINQYDYRYRLIESALKDESELEDFLLSNIKVEGNDL